MHVKQNLLKCEMIFAQESLGLGTVKLVVGLGQCLVLLNLSTHRLRYLGVSIFVTKQNWMGYAFMVSKFKLLVCLS